MSETRTITILGDQADDGGWGAWSPQILGVNGHGETFEEAVSDWHVAAALYREVVGPLDVAPDAAARITEVLVS
jgi:predicted RNase H-like HicB family nuclease